MIIKIVPASFVLSLVLMACNINNKTLSESIFPYYSGKDLGSVYDKTYTTFKVWSPVADKMTLKIYNQGKDGEMLSEHHLSMDEYGVWSTTVQGDLNLKYYTYQATVNGELKKEVADPYAKAVGVNGMRSMVVDLSQTNPEDWEDDQRPPLQSFSDIVLYELHIRDFSIHSSSGNDKKGKYLAFTEEGTQLDSGEKTGIDHLKELGITHVHLLPSFDFRSIDEEHLEENMYNWGYDPQNYNVPEGSYSTDPYHGEVRIKEFKKMVQSLHNNGIRVIMDVVYNHTGLTHDSNFDQLVPGYYYRQNQDGSYSDASACGNETASEKYMFRKFMIESVVYWAEEYHIDGFRFDLMGIHDIETMEEISNALKEIDPTLYVYGEGWTASASPLEDSLRALKANTKQLSRVAAFSDDFRDGIKGHWANEKEIGFVAGKNEMEETIKSGIVGSTNHPQVDYSKVNYSDEYWANEPWQTINYVSCHDNHTLYDKLKISTEASEEEIVRMHLLANTMVLTSQGVPFLHAGAEILRTKKGDHNSYKSPDSINAINWKQKSENLEVYNYYKNLIQLRKSHKVFRQGSTSAVQKNLKFLNFENGLVSYIIKSAEDDLGWNEVIVAFNGSKSEKLITLPEGQWRIALHDGVFYHNKLFNNESKEFNLPPTTALILHR